MANLAKIIARMQAQIVELQRAQANVMRNGRVVAVDPANQRVRVDVGDVDNPAVSPWIKWPERAGARRTWNPPTVGEEMTVLSPGGEIGPASVAMPGGFTNDTAAPSGDGDAAVFTLGGVTVTSTANGVQIVSGGTTVDISPAGLAVTGGSVTHNGNNIGDTHKHGKVLTGPAKTDVPS